MFRGDSLFTLLSGSWVHAAAASMAVDGHVVDGLWLRVLKSWRVQ